MRNIIVLLLAFSLFGAQCEKNPTPTDSFYFRCYVDGKEYIPNNCANCITCTILRDTILLLGANKGFESVNIGINDGDLIGVKTYTLSGKIGRQGGYDNSPLVDDIYKTDNIHSGPR